MLHSTTNNKQAVKEFRRKAASPPHFVTHEADESILKSRFRCDTLSPAYKSAAPCYRAVYCIHRLMHFNGGGEQPTKLPLLPG